MFTDQGLMSGSGLTILPTATIVPPMEFRVQGSRIIYFKKASTGVNVIGMSAGLSSALEGYTRLTSEQSGSFASQVAYGFGGKFRVPRRIPVIHQLALWADITSTDQPSGSTIFPSEALHAGITATIDSNSIHPTVLLGISAFGGATRVLAGAGVTIGSDKNTQLGFEVLHGYLRVQSTQFAMSGSLRIMPNISFHLSPGYLAMPGVSTWTFLLGVSMSTADVDFHPVYEKKQGDEFILPSIEDIEKLLKEEQQPSSNNGLPPEGSDNQKQMEGRNTSNE